MLAGEAVEYPISNRANCGYISLFQIRNRCICKDICALLKMSRKNNQSKRRNQHAYDLKCERFFLAFHVVLAFVSLFESILIKRSVLLNAGEKSLLLAKKVASEKKAAKSKSKLSQKGGEVNKVKRRGVRVKKGVRIKVCLGICSFILSAPNQRRHALYLCSLPDACSKYLEAKFLHITCRVSKSRTLLPKRRLWSC